MDRIMKKYQDNTAGNYPKQNWRINDTTGGISYTGGIFCGQCGSKMFLGNDNLYHCPYCMTEGEIHGNREYVC